MNKYFTLIGHSPVTVITYEDKLKTDQQREVAFIEASAATGSPRDRTFFISNYTHDKNEYSLSTEKTALDILETVLYSAERFVKIHKLRQHHHGGSSGAVGTGDSVKQFFAGLQAKYKWESGRVSRVLKALEEQEVNTVSALKECWEDVKNQLSMSIPMRRMVEKELKLKA